MMKDHPVSVAALTAAFEQLGPDAVERGLNARGKMNFEDCFLARVYGPPGVLSRAINNFCVHSKPVDALFNLLRDYHLTEQMSCDIVQAWDFEHERFIELAEAWLEKRRREPDTIRVMIDIDYGKMLA